MEVLHKRMRTTEGSEGEGGGEVGEDEETAAGTGSAVGSEEMELQIQRVLDRIEQFTQQVSELLESGRALFKNLSTEFEERLISIHTEHIEKWQEEIKELRMQDASNEAARALLHNAQYHLLQNVQQDSSEIQSNRGD